MLFSSMIFLWVFLPCVLIGDAIINMIPFENRAIRTKVKNTFLLVASLIFYAWGGVYYLLIMLTSIGINYVGGQLLAHRYTEEADRKKCLAIVVCLNLFILFVFKYFNMVGIVIENLISDGGSILGMQGTGVLNLPYIVLPIGISFFTFQAMSYVIDVYRGDAPVQDDLFSFALYVSFFPQLIAGPIVRYLDVAKEINEKRDKTEMEVSYKPKKSGQGGKVYGVDFYIRLCKSIQDESNQTVNFDGSELSEDDKLNFYDEIRDMIEDGIKSKDARAIAEASGFNMDIIKEKYT